MSQPRTATDHGLRKEVAAMYLEHVKEHGPGCQICGNVPKTRRLDWDHDHRTGLTRGWLCHRCNRALPNWITPAWLRAAADYLER